MVDRFATVARLPGLACISSHDLGLSKAKAESESEWVWKSTGFQICKNVSESDNIWIWIRTRIPNRRNFIVNFKIVWCWKRDVKFQQTNLEVVWLLETFDWSCELFKLCCKKGKSYHYEYRVIFTVKYVLRVQFTADLSLDIPSHFTAKTPVPKNGEEVCHLSG